MHIFGYVTDGFQSLNHSAVLNLLVFLGVLVVYDLDWFCSEYTSAHAGGFCPANVETFDPRTDYSSGTRICIRRYFAEKWEERLYV